MKIKNIVLAIMFTFVNIVNLFGSGIKPNKTITTTNSITYYDHQLVDSWYTDATNILYVPHFNPQVGQLSSTKVYLRLNITNKFAFENRQDVSFANPDFIGTIWVTNTVTFGGVEVLTMNVTNTFDATGFDGVVDYAGTSGFTTTNILNKTVVFDVPPQDVVGYSVWQAVNQSSARSWARMYTGNLQYAVMTTAGVDIWVVYTYTNQYQCPNCEDCDKDKDSDKDSDKDRDKPVKNKSKK
jgi:hypothetical protein